MLQGFCPVVQDGLTNSFYSLRILLFGFIFRSSVVYDELFHPQYLW